MNAASPIMRQTIRNLLTAAFIASLAVISGAVQAQEKNVIKPRNPGAALKGLISGYDFSPLNIRALQDDDFDNPGFRWVKEGEVQWSKIDGEAGKSCQSCHGEKKDALRGRALHYPDYDPAAGRIMTLQQTINRCRVQLMKAPQFAYNSREMLGLTALIRWQSKGLPMQTRIDGQARAAFAQGRSIYNRRMGQLGMSCAHCHNKHFGKNFEGSRLNQGHSNGFPAYFVGARQFRSLHMQFDRCFARMKAEPYSPGSEDYVALELYLARRGAGLPLETPAVRE